VLIAVALHKTGVLRDEDLRTFQIIIDHTNVLFSVCVLPTARLTATPDFDD